MNIISHVRKKSAKNPSFPSSIGFPAGESMALTVSPPASFSEFGWIFNNSHLDRSIYCDEDDIMDFSDSSGDFVQSHNAPNHQVRIEKKLKLCNIAMNCLIKKIIRCV